MILIIPTPENLTINHPIPCFILDITLKTYHTGDLIYVENPPLYHTKIVNPFGAESQYYYWYDRII